MRRCCVHGRLQGGRFTNVINAQYCAPRYDTRSDTVTNAETLSGFFADIVAARPAHVATKSTETNTFNSWNDGAPLSSLCKAVFLLSRNCGPVETQWSSVSTVDISGNSVVRLGRWGSSKALYETNPFLRGESFLEIDQAQHDLTRPCTTCHQGKT